MYVHFKDTDTFTNYCFDNQQSSGLDNYVATDWKYDKSNSLCQATLLNPFFEQAFPVTLAVSSRLDFEKIIKKYSSRFAKQFFKRLHTFNKPTYEVVAEYNTWQSFRDVWFLRNDTNITRVSVPLLFDLRQSDKEGHTNIFVTLYVTKSQEFYRFALAELPDTTIPTIKNDMKKIIEEAYVS